MADFGGPKWTPKWTHFWTQNGLRFIGKSFRARAHESRGLPVVITGCTGGPPLEWARIAQIRGVMYIPSGGGGGGSFLATPAVRSALPTWVVAGTGSTGPLWLEGPCTRPNKGLFGAYSSHSGSKRLKPVKTVSYRFRVLRCIMTST